MINMHSNVEQLLQSCDFVNLEVLINDKVLKKEYIEEFSTDWNGTFRIYGRLIINDIFDLVNYGLDEPGQKITIKYTDLLDNLFERDFIVTKSTESKSQDSKGITIHFQDMTSWKLQNTFIAKSYESTTLSNVFKEYLGKTDLELKIHNSRVLKNFVVPLHMDFLTFIEIEFIKEGIFFYQTRDKIYIGEWDIGENELPYKQAPDNAVYGFNIIEYLLTFNNVAENNNHLPNTDFMAFDKDSKSMTHYIKNLDDYKDVMNLGGKVKNSQLTIGTKHNTKEYLLDDTYYRYIDYKDNTVMNLYVPGNIDFSVLYKLIDVELTGNINSIDTRNKGDVRLSGKYEISRVEDKFMLGKKFVQKLTVRRVNEGIEIKGSK